MSTRTSNLPPGVLEARANADRERDQHQPPTLLQLAHEAVLVLNPDPRIWTRPDGTFNPAAWSAVHRGADGTHLALTVPERVENVDHRARTVFGDHVLLAAAAKTDGSTRACRWCFAKAGARVDDVEVPQVAAWTGAVHGDLSMAKALGILLGQPCLACARIIPGSAWK